MLDEAVGGDGSTLDQHFEYLVGKYSSFLESLHARSNKQ